MADPISPLIKPLAISNSSAKKSGLTGQSMTSPLKIGSFIGIGNVMNETKFRRTRKESNIKCSEADEILITNGSEDNDFNNRARSNLSVNTTS